MKSDNPIKTLWKLMKELHGYENLDEDAFGEAFLYSEEEIEIDEKEVDMEWWKEPKHEIGTLENADEWVTRIYARKCGDGVWEYAGVRWRYQQPTLLWRLVNGKLEMGE